MALEGEHRTELLSAYLDGELSDREATQLDEQLAEDSNLRADLEDLREQQSMLRAHFEDVRTSRPASDLTQRVLAEVLTRSTGSSETPVSPVLDPMQSDRSLRWGMIPAAFAASLMLAAAIFSRGLLGPSQDGLDGLAQNEPVLVDPPGTMGSNPDVLPGEFASNLEPRTASPESESAEAGNVTIEELNHMLVPQETPQYVSDLKFGGLQYVLVVDVIITDEAARKGVLERLLAKEQVPVQPPIVLDAGTAQGIEELRMNVRDKDSLGGVLYFLRAGENEIGNVLDAIYSDEENFPGIAFDIAVDTPQVSLMQGVARTTGERFTAAQKFAAPISVRPEDLEGSSISGLERPKLVSKKQRELGMRQSAQPLDGGDTLSSVLLIVHAEY